MGRQTLRKQLGSGSRQKTARRVIPSKSAKQTSQSRRVFYTNIFHQSFRQFLVPSFSGFSASLGGNVSRVYNILSSQEQNFYPTVSLNKNCKNCKELKFQRDLNIHVGLRQTSLASKLKFVKGWEYETYETKEVKKEHKEEAEVVEETEEQEAPVPLVRDLSNILHLNFSNSEVYINNQQNYLSTSSHANKSYLLKTFKVTTFEYKGFCKTKRASCRSIFA